SVVYKLARVKWKVWGFGCVEDRGVRQQHVNDAPSTGSFPNWRSILSPTWPSTETKTPSVADLSLGQTLENADLLQMIRTTLTGARARTLDQMHLSPSLYQGSGSSAPQEPAEVSAESPLRPSPHDADDTAALTGLPQLGMFATLPTTPPVTHLGTAVPSQPVPLETTLHLQRKHIRIRHACCCSITIILLIGNPVTSCH
ncbi:hypothetical protein EK904_012449, partial [Melospiza melodia maxima]